MTTSSDELNLRLLGFHRNLRPARSQHRRDLAKLVICISNHRRGVSIIIPNMIIMRPSPIPLLFAVAVKSLKIPQNPMGLDVAATPCDGDKYQPCGWRLWGRYKLYNYGWEYCPTFNESSTGATVVSMYVSNLVRSLKLSKPR